MKKNIYSFLFLLILSFCKLQLAAQERILIHSHNDHHKRVPFYQAYAQQIASIGIDVSDQGGELVLSKAESGSSSVRSFHETYISPIVNLFEQNNGKLWKDSDYTLTLLINLKTPALPTLGKLKVMLESHPEVFNPENNPMAVKVVVSGEKPESKDFAGYAPYITFDGDRLDYTEKELEHISVISFPLRKYTDWNGKGMFKKDQLNTVSELIESVHVLKKPIRFYSAPDGVNAWNMLHNMGVDYISTTKPELCSDFFHHFANKNYSINGNPDEVSAEISRYEKLDKTTIGFQGFNNKLLQLSKGIDVYKPTYKPDGVKKRIKNIILLIGDGTGSNQLQAAATVNNPGYINGMGLTIFNMKYTGFQNTSAQDSYTTDSAAGGSALATGELHDNRHISMSNTGEPYPSFTDYMYNYGYACGVITLGNLADATPAAYYGHSTERDNSDEITGYLLDGKLTLLNGAGMQVFTKRNDKKDILSELEKQYRISTTIDDINADNRKVICIDERMDLAASEKTLSLLAQATRQGIEKLAKINKKGFFLMVEGAKIDYAGHANSLPGVVVETLSFDLAVAEALKFADTDRETLVIVTGDHETGGLTFVDGDSNTGHITARFGTDDHTAMMLPIFAYGPGAYEFTGVYKNTEIFHKMKRLMGFKDIKLKK
ncbi:MAG: alkaline phosphatase [Prevotella sp.]|nr:alkaline phosphatase [Prevotella sp.]